MGRDTITISDGQSRILNLYRNNQETINIYDLDGRLLNIMKIGSDSIIIYDSEGNLRNVYQLPKDAILLLDSSNGSLFLLRSGGESLSLGDIASRIGGMFRINAETVLIPDAGGKAYTAIRTGGDLLNFGDVSNRLLNLLRTQPDIINFYDSNLKIRGVYQNGSEAISLSEAQISLRNVFKTQSEIISLPDSYARLASLFRLSGDSANLYDAQSRLLNFMRANNDALQITDSDGRTIYLYRSSPDAISVYDSEMKLRNVYNVQSELLNINDIGSRMLNIFRAQSQAVNVYDSGGKIRSAYQAQNELVGIGDIGNRILNLFRANTESLLISDTGIKIRYAYGSQNELINVYTASSSIKNLFRANGDTLTITDSSGKTVYLVRVSQDQISVYDSEMKLRGIYLVQTELISFNDIANRILNLFRAQGETINIYDSISKSGGIQNILRSILENIGITDASTINQILFRSGSDILSLSDIADRIRSLFRIQSDIANVYDSGGKIRTAYQTNTELISLNDIAGRLLGFFRGWGETVSVYDSATKPRMVNITSFTAQPSLYQNQYQTFDLTLNNTGRENVSVDYNITIFNYAGSLVGTVVCPDATCPYNLAVGQTLISTTSWFTGSNAVGSYTAQAKAFYSGASVSRNVSFSIVATPSQPTPSAGGGGGGSSAVSAPVSQPIQLLGNIGVEFSDFTVLREIIAGESFAAGARIRNSDKVPHDLSVSISGLPDSWVTITPDKQKIPANSEVVANILIATPANIVPSDYRVETSASSEGGTVSKSFFIMRVKNAPDILNVRPVVNREIRIDEASNETEVSIFVRNGKNPVQLTRVTERIPKALAQSVSDVSFDNEPTKVLEKDPVVQWGIVFNPGEEDTKIIKYRVKKVLDDYSQYVYWNLEQMSVYPYLAGALPFSFHPSSNTLAKNQFNPVAIELMNDGNASFDATLSFETPEGWVIIPKEVSRTVEPGKSGSFPFEIKPEIASDGPYTLTLKAVLDRKTYSQQIDFFVTSFKPEQLIVPAIFALLTVIAAYAIVRARTRRSRPRISHALDVIRDRN